ncbi:hypothetical protein [Haloarcula marina]|uniref:hypothetical protein n=1 Tax=Haloarcula marina TaxID=2961574 RepID=UPI0020B7FE65|nr:hypothetical protein [Halomicroarcula marina]
MFRRSFLTAASVTLAGCGLAPSPPSTESYPESPPNVLLSFAWDPERSVHEIRFSRGSRVTPENTGELLARTVEGDSETVWVSGERDGVADFPLTPGATLTHSVSDRHGVRVVWVAPDEDRSILVGRHRLPSETTTATTESER